MISRRGLIGIALLGIAGLIAVGLLAIGNDGKAPEVKRVTVESPEPPPEGEISVAYPEEPLSFNPYSYSGDTNATRDLLRPVLPTLLEISPDLEYRPSLATRVPRGKDITRDPHTITYRLNERAVWSDGTPISAADVRFTWETIRDGRWAIADRLPYEHVTDVQVVAPKTVKLVLDGPYSAWRDLFSAGDFILPKHLLEGKDFSGELLDQVPFSGGPFVIEGWTRGLEIVYRANPNWWGRGPGYQTVRVYFVPDHDIALELLERERVDAMFSTTQVNIQAEMEAIDGVQVKSRFGSSWWEVAFNNESGPASRRGVRLAVARALDRAGITEALVRTGGRPLQHLAPGRKLGPAFAPFTKDLTHVEPNLREAGFVIGRDGMFTSDLGQITISTPSRNAMGGNIERALQMSLRNAGLQIQIANPEPDIFYGLWRREGNFDIAVWERRGTPSMSLASSYRSDRAPPTGINYTRARVAELDAALEAADRTLSGEAAVEAVMAKLGEVVPAIPVFESKAFIASRGIRGPDPNATIEGPFWNLGAWRKAA